MYGGHNIIVQTETVGGYFIDFIEFIFMCVYHIDFNGNIDMCAFHMYFHGITGVYFIFSSGPRNERSVLRNVIVYVCP